MSRECPVLSRDYRSRESRGFAADATSFGAILKRGVVGTFHHVSEAHLARRLAEFNFRCSNRIALGITDTMRTDELLRQISGKRLTFRRTGQAAHALAKGSPRIQAKRVAKKVVHKP